MAEETTEVTESTGVDTEVTETTEAPEVTETTETTEAPETTEGTESTEVTEETTEETKEEETKEDSETPETFYNGEPVEIEVPDDLKEALSESGVDVNKVIGELYGKDSDFTLSEETRAPLDEKYGKVIVDTFLNALKAQNDSVLTGQKSAQEAAEKAEQAATEWSNELVGGEENWTALEAWATDNLEDKQIESFNKAMESGDKYLQELAIKDLHGKMRAAEGDTEYNLVSGDSAPDSVGAPLSGPEYINEMTSPTFMKLRGTDRQKAQAALDARRRAGHKRGL